MLPSKELSKGGALAALMLNAGASQGRVVARTRRRAEGCMRCGLKRVPQSSIVVRCVEGPIVEAGICGPCTKEMAR